MTDKTSTLSHSLAMTPEILRRFGRPLAGWFLACLFFDLWNSAVMSLQMNGASNFKMGFSVLTVLGVLLEALANFGFYGAVILAVGRAKGFAALYDFSPGWWLKDLTLELIKAFLLSCLWLLALIIPGVVRFARYLLVPVVVLWEPEYLANKVDALKTSQNLSKGHLPVLLAVLTGHVVVAAIQGEFSPLDPSIAGYALTRMLSFFMVVFLYTVVCNLYFDIRKKSS